MSNKRTWNTVVKWLKNINAKREQQIQTLELSSPLESYINTTVLVREDGSLFHWQGPYWHEGAPSVWVSDDGRFQLTKPALWDVLDHETDTHHSFMGYELLMRWVREQYNQ